MHARVERQPVETRDRLADAHGGRQALLDGHTEGKHQLLFEFDRQSFDDREHEDVLVDRERNDTARRGHRRGHELGELVDDRQFASGCRR